MIMIDSHYKKLEKFQKNPNNLGKLTSPTTKLQYNKHIRTVFLPNKEHLANTFKIDNLF